MIDLDCQNKSFRFYEKHLDAGMAVIAAFISGRLPWRSMAVRMFCAGVFILSGNAIAADVAPDVTAVIEQARTALNAGKDADALLMLQRVIAVNLDLSTEPDLLNKIDEIYRLAGRTTPASLHLYTDADTHTTWMGFRPKGWLAVTSGYDTNINSACNLTSVSIPSLNNQSYAVPSPLLTGKPSAFTGLGGGLDLRQALSPQTRMLLLGQFQTRYNHAYAAYLPYNYYVAGAIQHSRGATEFTVSVSHAQQWVTLNRMLESSNIVTQASYYAQRGLEFSLAAEVRSIKYSYFSPVATRGKLLHLGARDLGPGLAVSLMAGRDTTGGRAPELDRAIGGWTIDWGKDWGVHRVGLHASISHADYDATSQLFLTRRQDRNRVLAAEYSYHMGDAWKQWYLTPRFIAERNRSNIPLSAYTRRQMMLELRWEY